MNGVTIRTIGSNALPAGEDLALGCGRLLPTLGVRKIIPGRKEKLPTVVSLTVKNCVHMGSQKSHDLATFTFIFQ